MYAYDEIDRTLINERVTEFRDQVKRRLSGELTEDEFKMLRLQNGVYLQLHAYMFRVAIPYGTLSSKQLRRLAHVARRYDRGYGHFTTRQNVQYNWIKLAELPDALADLAEVGIHAMQTSGNNMRNVTSDQWAGVAPGEIEDPRIWSEILRQHTTLHPEFSFLPRKFKIAITASDHDRAAIKIHDIGLRLYRNAEGETGFEVLVGGGLGRTPFIAKTIKPFVSRRDILSYVEAILPVYNQYGRRDNIYKARIKILVHELGIEKFAKEVEEEWQQLRDGALTLDRADIEDIRSRFSYPAYERLPQMPDQLKQTAQELTRRFANHDTASLIGRLHINISGCINACGHHHVGHIGILGVEKNGEEFYQITIGGRADEGAQMGTLIGPAIPYAEVADVIEDIVEAYLALRDSKEELFVDTVKRLGVEPFRERVYATR